jgi:hypothetical protein
MTEINRLKQLAGINESLEPFESVVRRGIADMRAFMDSEPVSFDDAEHLASEWFAQHPGGHGDWNKLSPDIKQAWIMMASIAINGASDE